MSVLSIEFWIICTITIILCYFINNNKIKNLVIFLFSCLFYGLCNWKCLLLLLLYSIFTYVISYFITGVWKKVFIVLYVSTSLVLLGVFKYANFFMESISEATNQTWNFNHIILPMGISFYILSSIGYMLDVYREKYQVERDILYFMSYILFFPKIVSGPIERGNIFLMKLKNTKKITKTEASYYVQILVWGLLKKLVIADRLGVFVDHIYTNPNIYDAMSLIFAVFTYSIQIYCDFSGYTDIAIAISGLMGIPLESNFNLPYCSINPSDFWRRWHITLSSWFRDYVYIPLGGNRKGEVRTYYNTWITMLLSGIWHGANWTFVVWGFLHGIAQCIQKLLKKRIRVKNVYIKILVNFLFVTFCWIFFRAGSVSDAISILIAIFSWQSGIKYLYTFAPIYFIIVWGWQLYNLVKNDGNAKYPIMDLKKTICLAIFTVEIIVLISLAYFGNTAFIYNKF